MLSDLKADRTGDGKTFEMVQIDFQAAVEIEVHLEPVANVPNDRRHHLEDLHDNPSIVGSETRLNRFRGHSSFNTDISPVRNKAAQTRRTSKATKASVASR